MRYKEWKIEIADLCQFAKESGHSTMCHEGTKNAYCDFKRCPKIEFEKKED